MVQISHYDIGDIWKPQASFNVGGTPTDPTTLTYYKKNPGGTITSASVSVATLTSVSSPVAKTTVGTFVYSIPLDAAGHWYARFEGTGAVVASEDHETICDPSPFYDTGGLDPQALVSLGETKDWLAQRNIDTRNDDKIVQAINGASTRLAEVAGREFKPETTALTQRSFDIYALDCYGVKYVGDLATLTSATASITQLQTGTVVQTLTPGTDFVAMPRNRKSWEPITALRFLNTASAFRYDNVLNITAVWGFPSVPEDIRRACKDTVAYWLDRDVEHYRPDLGAVPGGSEGGQTVIVGSAPTILPLPPEAFSVAKDYRLNLVA